MLPTVAALAGRLQVVIAVCVGALAPGRPRALVEAAGPSDERGMWIWQATRSHGGDPTAIAKRGAGACSSAHA